VHTSLPFVAFCELLVTLQFVARTEDYRDTPPNVPAWLLSILHSSYRILSDHYGWWAWQGTLDFFPFLKKR